MIVAAENTEPGPPNKSRINVRRELLIEAAPVAALLAFDKEYVSMNRKSQRFFGGLIWYLETRNWAFEKMKSSPHGSNTFDLRMHHSLFFVNLISAVDHIIDQIKDKKAEKTAFINRIKSGFGSSNDYCYVLELRNSVVHRGLDLIAAGHSDKVNLYILCPATVEDRHGKNTYSCSFRYLLELAQKCRDVIDPAIGDLLEGLNLFDQKLHETNRAETVDEIDNSAAMPNWAKALAKQTIDQLDYSDVDSKLAKERVDKMRTLLGLSY